MADPFSLIIMLGTWAKSNPLIILWGMGGLVLFLGVVSRIAGTRPRTATTHGSARWATRGEIRRAGLYARHGVILGQIETRILRSDGEEHILLIGATRGGKGVGIIIPTLLTWRESVMVLDAKDGENFVASAKRRSQWSTVLAFTPCRPPTTRINVLDTVRLRTPREVGDAQLIAQSLVAPAKLTGEGATAVHFRELASLLLTSTILHVCYVSRRKSLAGVWDFLTQQHATLGECLKTMTRTAHQEQGAHPAIVAMTHAIQNITGDRELSGVWTTAIRPLVLYSDPLIAANTDTSTCALEEIQHGDRPISLYLIAPSPMELDRLHPLYRVILEVYWTRLMERPVRTWKWRLLNCCDELPWYGYTRVIDKGIATKAGYGMKDLLVAQDLDQLQEVYGPHSAIFGNCAIRVYQTVVNDHTAKRISENLLGRATIESEGETWGGGIGGRRSRSVHQTSRPLLTPDEVMGLPVTEEIIHLAGRKPIRAGKCDYRRQPF